MKNKKGFTLIELLAIIVILAIIAVITVPIILNIIDNSKQGAATDSAHGYKDAIDKFYISKLSLDPNYTLHDGKYVKDQLKYMGVAISGKEPSSTSWVKIQKNKVISGCLEFDEYKVSITNGIVENAKKGKCVFNASFYSDSWDKIIENLTNDRHCYDEQVGSTKIISMNLEGTNKNYKLRLVNTSPCEPGYTGSKTSCGVVIEFGNTIGKHVINSTSSNAGGWYSSEMRTYLNTGNDSIYNKLKTYLGENTIIKTAPVISGAGKNSTSNNAEDYVYLLSPRELGLSNVDDATNNDSVTNTLDFYKDKTNEARVKYDTASGSGSYGHQYYWLRTAHKDSTYGVCGITTGGENYLAMANEELGVAPAFRIFE